MSISLKLAEKGLIPDFLIRYGIRKRLGRKLRQESDKNRSLEVFAERLHTQPIAIATDEANEQHYEVPSEYFHMVLGPYLKYSSTYWPEGIENLDASEEAMLKLTAERAQIEDGQRILDLGCGWGSFSLWAARHYPQCRFLAVSNSNGQGDFIRVRAAELGLNNIEHRTADMNTFEPGESFDRVVSVEMFEHMKNWAELLRRISTWLNKEGKLFVHIFSHAKFAYPYEVEEGGGDWMARYFFTGGMMPSHDLIHQFRNHLTVEEDWHVPGNHYARTLETWLKRHDAKRAEIMKLFREDYGEISARLWFNRWRLFYLACAELFNFNGGNEWSVSHYRLKRTQ